MAVPSWLLCMVWQLTQSPVTAPHAGPARTNAASVAVTASKSEVFLSRFFILFQPPWTPLAIKALVNSTLPQVAEQLAGLFIVSGTDWTFTALLI
jgi:hypothetical protein